jgi:hypothetical protein
VLYYRVGTSSAIDSVSHSNQTVPDEVNFLHAMCIIRQDPLLHTLLALESVSVGTLGPFLTFHDAPRKRFFAAHFSHNVFRDYHHRSK